MCLKGVCTQKLGHWPRDKNADECSGDDGVILGKKMGRPSNAIIQPAGENKNDGLEALQRLAEVTFACATQGKALQTCKKCYNIKVGYS